MKSLTTKEENVLEIIKEIDGDFSEVDNDKLKVSICDYILDGNLFIKYNFLPKKFTYEKELKYDIDNFDWDFVYAPLPSPCQMYLHSFNHIKYLIQGYELTLNEKYIDLAGHLIRSWLNYEQQSENNFIWLKDTGPDRSIVMLYFILISKKNNIVKNIPLINEMKSSLKKHANFFYNDNYYKPHNHGTMIDRALYLVAIYLNDSSSAKYRKKIG